MNKIDWEEKGSRLIFIIIFILLFIIIGLKVIIKDIKHNKDTWYFLEEARYDYTQLTIEEYVDKGFLKKTVYEKYDKIEQEKIYIVPNGNMKLLFNSKDVGKPFDGIIDIDLILDNKQTVVSKWDNTSTYFTFTAPSEEGEYEYTLEVTYDNTDVAKYKCILEVASNEKIREIKSKNVNYNKKKKVEIQDKEYQLELVGMNSSGALNYKLNKIDPLVYDEMFNISKDKIMEKTKTDMYLYSEKSNTKNIVFSEEVGKFVIEENIPFVYYYLKEGSEENTEINKKNVEKNIDGLYEIKIPDEAGKYIIVFESTLGNFYLKTEVIENISKEKIDLENKYKETTVNEVEKLQEMVDEIIEKKLLTKIPDLEKVEVSVEDKKINLYYYYNTKEADPEKLHITEEFNTKIKEELSIYLYNIVDNIEIINNINYTRQGKIRLQHEEKYNEIQIKQIFDRI